MDRVNRRALPEAELIQLLERIGFEEVRTTHRFDNFRETSKEDIAREYRVHGVNLFARKPRKAKRAIGGIINRLRAARKRHRGPNGVVEIGRPAPDFIVSSQPGPSEFRLCAERGHFVLLFFVPGAWCPVCHVNLRIYRQRASELAERNVKLAVVSMSSGPEAEAFAKEIGLDYVV